MLGHETKINLCELQSRAAYEKAVAATYASASHGWMTPVELFSPFLSRAVAHRIHAVNRDESKVNIIEIGGGRGTLAADILAHWSEVAPDFLRRVRYNLIEVSPALAKVQSENLRHWVNLGTAKVHNVDARIWFQSLSSDAQQSEEMRSTPCHVVAMEVLDNLPHDLLRLGAGSVEQAVAILSENPPSDSTAIMLEWRSELDETTSAAVKAFDLLRSDENDHFISQQRDPSFLSRARVSFENMLTGGKRDLWVPTASYQLLKAISSSLSHAGMTISDFNSFPGALPGENAPVVQRVQQGSTVVYESVTAAPFGKVDIMFPTNFHALQRCHNSFAGNGVSENSYLYRILSQEKFFEEHSSEASINATTCKDGYNPVLQDFENASFLLVDKTSKVSAG